MIAITGANGQLGQLTLQYLLTRVPASDLIALARNPQQAAEHNPAVVWRRSDYNDIDTMITALAGVSTLFMISGSEVGQRLTQHQTVIDAAKAAGVKHIVYTSILKADSSPLLLATEHKHTEAMLAASGISTVIMRNGWYSENYTQGIAHIIAAGTLMGAAQNGRFDTASRSDFAEAAANILANIDQHAGKTYELAGNTSFTLQQFADAISQVSGKPIHYAAVSQQTYQDFLTDVAGLPAGLSQALADSEAHASQGWLSSESRDLQQLLGRPTASLTDAVRASLN